MKLYILILIICLNSCKAQHTIITNNDIMIPQIDNKFEIFDINLFNKEVNPISGKRIEITEQVYLEEETQSPGYISRTYPNDSYFTLIKKYYDNGNIQEKSISFNNGHPIKIWYKFDKQGKLIKEIKTDIGYTFGWQKILNYCEENKITLTKGYQKGGSQTEIYKQSFENKKAWKIVYLKTIDGFPYYIEIILDGQTGELLDRKQAEFE